MPVVRLAMRVIARVRDAAVSNFASFVSLNVAKSVVSFRGSVLAMKTQVVRRALVAKRIVACLCICLSQNGCGKGVV